MTTMSSTPTWRDRVILYTATKCHDLTCSQIVDFEVLTSIWCSGSPRSRFADQTSSFPLLASSNLEKKVKLEHQQSLSFTTPHTTPSINSSSHSSSAHITRRP